MRIKTGHYYIIRIYPGISGFQKWDQQEYFVVSALAARSCRYRPHVVKEYLAKGHGSFRLGDGHLLEYQPVVEEVEALRWLDKEPFQQIYPFEEEAS